MQQLDRAHELILGVLANRGIASSQDLQAATGKSQATVSRLLSDLSGRVVALGRARATRYGLPRLIRGYPAQQPLWWTDQSGSVRQFGLLTFLAGDLIHVESDFVQAPASRALPWYLAPLRAQGFLGRLHARRLEAAGLGGDPEQWSLESALFAALHLHDAPGAITIGDSVRHEVPQPLETAQGLPRAEALDPLAQDVASTLPAGSAAGGEQPKFLATLDGGRHVIVKFTPPRGTPFGERWHDLLHAECLAARVLEKHGVEVSKSRVVESGTRTYLVSDRFDRVGTAGRRHVIYIGHAHDAFVPDRYSHWAATASALARQRRLSALDAERAAALLAFGRLIGNTDMHSGNLGLMTSLEDLSRGRFTLAPLYAMLLMRWRPDAALGGAPDYLAFEPDPASASSPAAGPAMVFWGELEAHPRVSPELKAAAGEMVRRIAAAWPPAPAQPAPKARRSPSR